MKLLPLALSTAGALPDGQPVGRQGSSPCRHCGFLADGWIVDFPSTTPGRPARDAKAHQAATASHASISTCVLCVLCRAIDRPTIDAEARLIWLPEMTQAAVNTLVRRLHRIACLHGAQPTFEGVPRRNSTRLVQAWMLHDTLIGRAWEAERRLGSSRFADLVAALDGLAAEGRRAMFGGLRLLPRGRFYRDGRDIYGDLLAILGNTPANPPRLLLGGPGHSGAPS